MKRLIGLTFLAAALALAGCGSSGGGSSSPSGLIDNPGGQGGYDGIGLTPPQPRPQFTLTDTAGKQFRFGTVTQGHPTLLYFGYTHCPDICPEEMANVGAALRRLPASISAQTYVVFVTTDVKRDTGSVIATWLSNFDTGSKAHWVGLRGTQAQIDAAEAAAHVTVAEDRGQTHSAQITLYGPDDYAHVSFLPTGREQEQILHDLPKVVAST